MKYFIILAMLTVAVGMTSCKGTRQDSQYQSADSVEFALYASKPLNDIEDCEPAYINIDILGLYHEGDTVYVSDTNNIVQTTFIRDAETHEPVGVHKVILQDRILHNVMMSKQKQGENNSPAKPPLMIGNVAITL